MQLSIGLLAMKASVVSPQSTWPASLQHFVQESHRLVLKRTPSEAVGMGAVLTEGRGMTPKKRHEVCQPYYLITKVNVVGQLATFC